MAKIARDHYLTGQAYLCVYNTNFAGLCKQLKKNIKNKKKPAKNKRIFVGSVEEIMNNMR